METHSTTTQQYNPYLIVNTTLWVTKFEFLIFCVTAILRRCFVICDSHVWNMSGHPWPRSWAYVLAHVTKCVQESSWKPKSLQGDVWAAQQCRVQWRTLADPIKVTSDLKKCYQRECAFTPKMWYAEAERNSELFSYVHTCKHHLD